MRGRGCDSSGPASILFLGRRQHRPMRAVVVVVPRPIAGPTQHADRALFAPFLVPGGIGRYVFSMLVVLVV